MNTKEENATGIAIIDEVVKHAKGTSNKYWQTESNDKVKDHTP